MSGSYNIRGDVVNNSAFYYNASMDSAGNQKLITTYTQLFQSLQLQFIDILFIISVAFLILTLSVLEYNKKNVPSWSDVMNNKNFFISEPDKRNIFLLKTCAGICFPLSLFFFFLMISVKYNLNW